MSMRDKRKAVVKRGEVALKALEMGILTKADKERVERVWRAFRMLDDEQAELRTTLEERDDERTAARVQCAEHQRGENAALNLLQEALEEVTEWSEDRLSDRGVDDQFADLMIRLEKFLEATP